MTTNSRKSGAPGALGGGAAALSAARQIMRDWLAFSTLRYYAVQLSSVKVEADGSVLVSLLLRVPAGEIHDQLERPC